MKIFLTAMPGNWFPCVRTVKLVVILSATFFCHVACSPAAETNSPATAREFYNEGTKLLDAHKLGEAERRFESALAAQDERVQPLAAYNLGQVRFADGLDIFKKGPAESNVSAQGNAAMAAADGALKNGAAALVDNQLASLLDAYISGRGARHNLREAEKAVKAAMDTYAKTLLRWQRADDDFKGAVELNPADTNAAYNARLIDQDIARLVDSLRRMQQMAGKMAGKKSELDKVLSKLKGQMPAPNAPPGGKGDDDEEGEGGRGDVKPESLSGKEENAGRDGEQIQETLSPEKAAQMLDGLPVDGGRRLPIGGDQPGEPPKDRHGRNW